ncbi:hypothetical protein [Longimicrobium terrae]|uniref:Uncharacterized protein n=1 Tax=Longimicrobium terrae TaxID=1639882 RepID=A0A841GNI3_9BACT|nr:hypothetical protein [Longimicrobium terrae]MBB4635985.1 hypothetical protein [Longimicrobium terrae]MBB6070381.1 hypothetical protein [Longimicrobium terrae]NNC30878.1 hypothetical protein [Longimicrobium terrae]
MNDPTGTEQSTYTLSDALALLRGQAAADPGHWKVAGSERAALTLEWAVDPEGVDTPEALRLTRRYVPPVGEDLERTAAALPKAVEIGPIRLDRGARTLTLGLRPRSARGKAERCARCGASPRYGTRLYGDGQLCAVCSLYGATTSGTEGSALIGALLVAILLSIVVGGAMLRLEAAERLRGAESAAAGLDAGGRGVIEAMTARLRARAALRLGALDEADVAALNADVASLAAPDGVTIDAAETGYRIVSVREEDQVPDDAELLDLWTDQPRDAYASAPRPQGQTASRTLEVEMRVRVRGAAGSRRTLTRAVAVSRIPAYPYALYSRGAPELCAGPGGATVSGAVRIDGLAYFPACAGPTTLIGTLDTRDGVRNDDPRNRFLTGDGSIPIESWSRLAAETGGTVLLASSGGRLRVPPAAGGTYEDGRQQEASFAGTGECADGPGACGGQGWFAPGASLQRTATGAAPGGAITCGQAYGFGGGCLAALGPAVRYHPWPWTAPVPAGVALPDPSTPGRLWKGLLFDPRREARCTATVGGHVYPTHRCPSNTFGWVLDLGALGPVEGGLVHVRAAAADPAGRRAAGAQEALVIRNAGRLAAPLTLVSEIPVFVVGSLNTEPHDAWRGPPPLMIDAPRITLVPAEADVQLGLGAGDLGWASVWDLVPPAGSTTPSALPLRSTRNATLYAVLRTRVCHRPGGDYQGGGLDQAPAVLGDWSEVEVRVAGAVEQSEDAGLSAAECRWWGAGYGAAADGSAWAPPAARTLLYDPRLGHPGFVVPGSFLPANLPSGGVPGAARRDEVRQARATGGYGVMRITRQTARRVPRPAVRAMQAALLPPSPASLPE